MAWTLTRSLPEFRDVAGAYLRADPVRNTVHLTILESLAQSGLTMYGEIPPVFGWHCDAAGKTDGAFLRTPPHPALLAKLPEGSAPALIAVLMSAEPPLTAVNLTGTDLDSFASAWAGASTAASAAASAAGSAAKRQRSRLFRLGDLVPPDPFPPGEPRLAGEADRDLLVSWHAAFASETEAVAAAAQRTVSDRLSHGGLTLWEADGEPVAMAALSRAVAGVTRVTTVYTPPQFRQRGYGGAVTTAVSRAALDAGSSEVVLFTDVANPTSNRLYQRLGYRPVEDRVLVTLQPAG